MVPNPNYYGFNPLLFQNDFLGFRSQLNEEFSPAKATLFKTASSNSDSFKLKDRICLPNALPIPNF